MGACISLSRRTPTLYVILPYWNPAGFTRRQQLLEETYNRLTQCQNVQVILAAIHYTDVHQPPHPPFLKMDQPPHLHFKVSIQNALWSKENLVNLAIEHLLKTTPGAKYFAWCDADIVFGTLDHPSTTWVRDTIQALDALGEDGGFVQMFEEAHLLDAHHTPQHKVKSFAKQYSVPGKHGYRSVSNEHGEYWHPGFAWATTAETFRRCGGLIEGTLGSADRHMAMALINQADKSMPEGLHPNYADMIMKWQRQVTTMRLGYVPGVIQHCWHGDVKHRKYLERWEILKVHQFDPSVHVERNGMGLCVWTKRAPSGLMKDTLAYFNQRNEDEAAPPRKQENTAPLSQTRPLVTFQSHRKHGEKSNDDSETDDDDRVLGLIYNRNMGGFGNTQYGTNLGGTDYVQGSGEPHNPTHHHSHEHDHHHHGQHDQHHVHHGHHEPRDHPTASYDNNHANDSTAYPTNDNAIASEIAIAGIETGLFPAMYAG